MPSRPPRGGGRLQRLALLGRAGRHPRRAVRASRSGTRSCVKLEVLGHTHQGREMIALKLTQGAREVPDGSRPAVLYSSNQHAREWISLEVNRRLLHHFIDRWRANDPAIRNLLQTHRAVVRDRRQPGRLPVHVRPRAAVAQEPARQQRRRADHVGDGVDPNRNFDEHWGYDNEGSSPDPADETYRGPSAGVGAGDAGDAGPDRPDQAEVPVEPALVRRVAALPAGLAGRDARRGQPDLRRARRHRRRTRRSRASTPASRPTRSTSPTARRPTTPTRSAGTIAYTPELGEGVPGRRVRLPRRRGPDPGGVREDARLPPRAGAVRGRSRRTRSRRSGIEVEPFYLDQDDIDPQNGQTSLFDFKFAVSYGDPQEVRVLAKRSLGAVTLKYRVNGGAVQTGPTSEWTGGETLRPRQRRVLPRRQRRGHRHRRRATASRCGSRAAARRATRSPTRSSPTPAGGC